MKPLPRLYFGLLTLLWLAMACALNQLGGTPAATTPTPVGDTLTYLVPLYSIGLAPGDTVPGTQLHYVQRNGDAIEVTIDGLPASKRFGDSFTWHGVVAPGVVGRYNLRLAPTFTNEIVAAGPVEVSILNPAPVALPTPPALTSTLHFGNIVHRFVVEVGGAIPGTTMVYEGRVEQGAQLGGIGGYPYRALGDSLIWIGRLRDNVVIRYSLRVDTISDTRLSLSGTADLWVEG